MWRLGFAIGIPRARETRIRPASQSACLSSSHKRTPVSLTRRGPGVLGRPCAKGHADVSRFLIRRDRDMHSSDFASRRVVGGWQANESERCSVRLDVCRIHDDTKREPHERRRNKLAATRWNRRDRTAGVVAQSCDRGRPRAPHLHTCDGAFHTPNAYVPHLSNPLTHPSPKARTSTLLHGRS